MDFLNSILNWKYILQKVIDMKFSDQRSFLILHYLKSAYIQSFSGTLFPAFGNLHSKSRIHRKWKKMWTRKRLN